MRILGEFFERNRKWAEETEARHPGFFNELSHQQNPEYLWIGCSDSRVPANEITGLQPGEIFVHRNVANLVIHTDMSCLSVIQYAVEVLAVRHIIVCGHYGCGGIAAAMDQASHGLIDNWLRHIRDIAMRHRKALEAIPDMTARRERLCELNIIEQVNNVCATTIVQDAWRRGRNLAIHGWIYSVQDGLLRDLDVCITGPDQLDDAYRIMSGG